MSPARRWSLTLLGVAVVAFPLVPLSRASGHVLYNAVAVLAVTLCWVGLRHHRPERSRGWVLVLSGFSLCVLGDLVLSVEVEVLGRTAFPAYSDAFFTAGYLVLVLGVLAFSRTRRQRGDTTAALDASIVTIGIAVPAVAFIIVPASTDSTLSLLGRLTASAYPAVDLFLVAVLARLLTTPGASTRAFRLVSGALALTLLADCAYDALVVGQPGAVSPRWMDLLWLSAYALLAFACNDPSMRTLTEPPPDREVAPTPRKLYLLAAGSMLPGASLLIDGANGGSLSWVPIGIGAIVLSALVLIRMAGLLGQVQVQAVQLAALAHVDALTGAPNRRTWDLELSRACATALEEGTQLALAVLDLDHFKAYNDQNGHPAGDRLLREAVAAWSEHLGPDQLLARYGGEEFAILLPRCDLAAARRVVEQLRPTTPGGQTFSAGVALWEPGTEPGAAVAAADAALYRAKRTGRDRVETSAGDGGYSLQSQAAQLRIVVQPLIDVATGAVVGHEALTRFADDGDIRAMYADAHTRGYGDLLEAHAVCVALARTGRPPGQRLYVNVTADAVSSPRFWKHMPQRLDGVVVELVEDDRVLDWGRLEPQVRLLRERGAQIAVDDLGAGAGDLARLLAIRPDIVKVDRDVVAGCAGDAVRSRLLEMILGLAVAGGAKVCAEGVETAADLAVVRRVGVHFAQGFLIGRPSAQWADGQQVAHAVGPGSGLVLDLG